MTKLRKESGHFASVYSPARLEEIGAAVQTWFESLAVPRIPKIREKLGVSQQATHRWRRGGGPLPIFMFRLWKDTDKPVFLLRAEERAICVRRGQDIPGDFPTFEDFTQDHPQSPTSPDPPIVVPQATSLPLSSIEGQLKHGLTVLQALMISLEAMAGLNNKAVNANVRQQAVKNVLRLIRVFGLTPEDFKSGPQAESDPGRIETLRHVFANLGLETGGTR